MGSYKQADYDGVKQNEQDHESENETWYEKTWDWMKAEGREFVVDYKQHWKTGNIWYDEANYWLLGIPDKVQRVFQTKPFSLENWEANLDLFVSVVPATKVESSAIDLAEGTSRAVGESLNSGSTEIRSIRSGKASNKNTETALESYGELGNVEDDIYVSAQTFRDNVQVRAAYINEVEALGTLETDMRARGCSLEEIARTLHQKRRDLGVKYKNMTSPEALDAIYKRNLAKYGDKLGPTFDYLIENDKTFEDIIESAKKTGEEFNKKAGLSQGGSK